MNENKTNINWYPGHMAKAKRKILESLKIVDIVAEIIDARVPKSSKNPDIDSIILNKPKIIVLSKSDLADPNKTSKWIDFYKNQKFYVIAVNCKTGKGINLFVPAIKTVLEDKIEKAKTKGINKNLRVMVVGTPNSGKSSFINRLSNGKKAKVENRPGVTRGNQWFSISKDIELLDTPGVLWPKFEDKFVGEKLAFTGAIKDQIIDIEQLAVSLLDYLNCNYRKNLVCRYKLEDCNLDEKVGEDLLILIAKKRGMFVSGGEIDKERASTMVLEEFRNGKLGRITLD